MAQSYHLVVELQRRMREADRRWNDPAALRARLDELSGRAVSYAATVVALHLFGTLAWITFDALT